MYEVKLINSGVETVIHYPTADQDAPHLNKLPLKEGLSLVDSLSFILYVNKAGYNEVFELTTKVKVIDVRDNSIRFTGRVLDINERMDGNGLFYKEITCEGALSYLNDTRQRANTFTTTNPADFLTQILAMHNSKVDSSRQIQVGNVDVTGSVAYTCNFDTTYNEILAVKEKIGGNIRVRETDGVLYLDWLQSFSSGTIDVTLGVNMKDMVKGKDVTSFGTRIIPLGANNLTIESVNGGLDYIEDATAKAMYGVIEKPVEYTDITDAQQLYNTCLADLSNYTQPTYSLECNALDLSYITGITANQFALGSKLHITNSVMAIDDIYTVVTTDLDLLEPYNPTLTIENNPIKLTTTLNDLRKSSVQNNGVYNNVQIGDSFGIRAVRNDGKVTTTINATEGISIENNNSKVFYVDENGKLVAVDIIAEGGNFNNITAEGGVFNNIKTDNMIAELMRTSNTDNYVIAHDQYFDFYSNNNLIMTVGFVNFFGIPIPCVYGYEGLGIGANGTLKLEGNNITANGQEIATQSWVAQYVANNMPSS